MSSQKQMKVDITLEGDEGLIVVYPINASDQDKRLALINTVRLANAMLTKTKYVPYAGRPA